MRAKALNPHIKAHFALFDMDGTLVETDKANFLAYKEACYFVLGQSCSALVDTNVRFNCNVLKQQFSDLDEFTFKRIKNLKNRLFNHYLSKTLVNSELVDTFIRLSEHKTIILVTNSISKRAIDTLSYHGLYSFVDIMLCSEDRKLNQSKYQHALDFLGISPMQVEVFENEQKEVKHALQAGIPATKIHLV